MCVNVYSSMIQYNSSFIIFTFNLYNKYRIRIYGELVDSSNKINTNQIYTFAFAKDISNKNTRTFSSIRCKNLIHIHQCLTFSIAFQFKFRYFFEAIRILGICPPSLMCNCYVDLSFISIKFGFSFS